MSTKIIELFDRAATKLKWPHIVFQIAEDQKLKFARMGPKSKNPGAIIITDGLPFGTNKIYGFIQKNGTVELRSTGSVFVHNQIERIIANPIEYSQINGKRYNICCFCGIELTSPNSVFYGYGPICASNWGLPWDDGSQREKENELIELLEKSGVKK